MGVDLLDAMHYAKLVGRTVAICLLAADGDAEKALLHLAELDVSDHGDPEWSDVSRTTVEQSIREAVAAVAAAE